MSRSEQLLQRLMSELRLKQDDIRRNACALSVTFTPLESEPGAFIVEVRWKDGRYQRKFDREYTFGNVAVGAEQNLQRTCWYWRDIVREILKQRGVM